MLILLLNLIGLCLSLYAYYLDYQITKNSFYKPLCDLSDKVSCSATIRSPYGKFFGISNGLAGVIFYSVFFLITLVQYQWLMLVFAAANFLVSIFFAYLLFFKVRTLCLVCISLYLISTLLFLLIFHDYLFVF